MAPIIRFLFILSLLASCDAFFPHHRVVTKGRRSSVLPPNKRQDFGPYTYNQRLNHDDPNSSVFGQRYWVNNIFSNGTGAPIYLYVGGEVTFSYTDVTATQWVRFAQTDNAYLLALEHRYFGMSQPNSDLSDLTYLTVNQAMADVVSFITWYKSSIDSPNSPVIVLGSSYGANLASWLRIKYPNVFTAAVASSGPVQLVKDYGSYYKVVSQSIDTITGSTACTTNIHNAMTAFESTISDPTNDDLLKTKFNLCYSLEDTSTDRGTLESNLNEIWATAVQYNYQDTITNYCNIMARTDYSPLDNLAEVNRQELSNDQRSCLNSAYDSLISFYRSIVIDSNAYVGYRQYFYLQCSQLGFFLTTSAGYPSQPFGSIIPVTLFDSQCRDTFGASLTSDAAVQNFNSQFGGKTPSAVGASRILYSNGAMDPWNSQSVMQNQSPTLLAYNMGAVGHSADIYPSYSTGPVQSQQNAMGAVLSQFLRSAASQSPSTTSQAAPTTSSQVVTPTSSQAAPSTTSQDASPTGVVVRPTSQTPSTTSQAANPTTNQAAPSTMQNPSTSQAIASSTNANPSSSQNIPSTTSPMTTQVSPTTTVTSSASGMDGTTNARDQNNTASGGRVNGVSLIILLITMYICM
ncbi:protease, serine, 16 (thymus) precursor [Planoprotostelium fungivorum]|uniref:Protease, serine, 16 (Thymus) n=1 Tax=Planoprotostelium fungivorum TaxID=1890364 RepID=A0A2P6MPC7_9EUKA|nr:protease, serine, 16 (thymus) precursor [Planoprotostelium fungivorum]